MSVLINEKICDNAAECSGIESCPTGALFWDMNRKKIGVNNDLCISCHECASACPVGAILVADNDEEFTQIRIDIESDTRTVEDLFVERYGAMPIDEELVLKDGAVDSVVNEISLVFIEQFQDSSIQCLLHSIPAELLVNRYGGIYRKQQVLEESEGTYPQLLIYKDGTLAGTIPGYFDDTQIETFAEQIDKIILNR